MPIEWVYRKTILVVYLKWNWWSSRRPCCENAKRRLSDKCESLTYEVKAAIEWSQEWPTLGDAEGAGYGMSVEYVEGMGTHRIVLNDFSMEDPSFDAKILCSQVQQ